MSGLSNTTIKTRCPVCRTKYEVPTSSVGHRARCTKCQTVFRVPKPEPQPDKTHPAEGPTDDDILKWLDDSSGEERAARQPRVASGATKLSIEPPPARPGRAPAASEPPADPEPPAPREPRARDDRPDDDDPDHSSLSEKQGPSNAPFEDRYSGPDSLLAPATIRFRKTG